MIYTQTTEAYNKARIIIWLKDKLELFWCLDCPLNTKELLEYYNVHDNIWNSVASPNDGMLCIGCLENRLGRRLSRNDFSDAPINHGYFPRSDRFIDRFNSAS
jgi:hypothetical protein